MRVNLGVLLNFKFDHLKTLDFFLGGEGANFRFLNYIEVPPTHLASSALSILATLGERVSPAVPQALVYFR